MEIVVTQPVDSWRGRKVLLTGHTGFKGSWLSHWLSSLGCSISGYALDPPPGPNMFDATRVSEVLHDDVRGDLRDRDAVVRTMQRSTPEVIFHLAAQPLVRESYVDPIGTFATNVMGTAHVLEAARQTPSVRAVVVVTTDKVYDNREWLHPYREIDPLGGHDPYSASKAAAEIATSSFRASFFGDASSANIATARAGNVIGGGDWAKDRLIPDCLAAFAEGRPVTLRYPHAVRPWQHVLEPLAGYIQLAEKLCSNTGRDYASAWNFGPDVEDDVAVGAVAQLAAGIWGHAARVEMESSAKQPHEAGLLRLDSTLARISLGWRPKWNLSTALTQTIAWNKAWLAKQDMLAVTRQQIAAYRNGVADVGPV